MKKLLIAFLAFTVLGACTKVPITGRRQMHLLPESMINNMSFTNYQQFLSQNKVVNSNDVDAQMVKRVGAKMAAAVTLFLKQKKMTKRVKGFKWEFNLVNDPTVNAWCMPGGKVVVYSGLLPVAKDETGLAVVMGHEIAHAIARHGNERMSQAIAVQAGGVVASVFLAQQSAATQNIFNQSYGIGSQLGMLKYSRTHESEADKMGLVFMAMAGYNPTDAIAFWERMSKSGGAKPPEILSSHPADETRIKDIKAFLPKAMKYYTKK